MYFHYKHSIKFIKKIVILTSDARPVNQLFGASGRFFHSGSQMMSLQFQSFNVLSHCRSNNKSIVLLVHLTLKFIAQHLQISSWTKWSTSEKDSCMGPYA